MEPRPTFIYGCPKNGKSSFVYLTSIMIVWRNFHPNTKQVNSITTLYKTVFRRNSDGALHQNITSPTVINLYNLKTGAELKVSLLLHNTNVISKI